ncbi:MAG TPA: zinc dependent phospholipase C family protein [Thermoanaerobaculia bacterium]|nr:zinc dependent phospholipase C family protein [Thermoanaerobaculia bacterium]
MPKYGIHHIVLRHAIDKKLASGPSTPGVNAAATLKGELDAAMLGAVGPDLFFFAPDYPAMQPIITLYTNYKKVLDLWEGLIAPIKQINEQFIEPVEEAVKDAIAEDAINLIEHALQELKETAGLFASAVRTGLLAGVVEGVDNVFDPNGVPLIQSFFNTMFTPSLQNNAPVNQWFWFDMLHYRRTGRFARRLVENATTDRQKAYALGYLSHVAADVTGHAYVNQIVGAPYRRNVQRHVTSENFMDTWAFDHYFGESVSSTLLQRLALTDDSCTDDIAALLVTAMQKTYTNDFPWPGGQQKPLLSAEEIQETYVTFHGILGVMARMGIERPEEPFSGALAILEKAWKDVIKPPPSPPSTNSVNCDWKDMLGLTSKSADCYKSLFESLGEWFSYFNDLALWLVDRVKELIDFLLTALATLPVMVLLALLYAIQLLMYELYRLAHWTLAIQGFVFPLRDELSNSVSARLIQADLACLPLLSPGSAFNGTETRYPQITQLGDSHLLCPFRGFESAPRIWNFVATGSPMDPRQFIEALPFSQGNLTQYAQAGNTEKASDLANEGRAIGNAVDLTAWMITTANNGNATPEQRDVCFANWNLDSDRGYGSKSWSGIVEPTAVKNEVLNEAT